VRERCCVCILCLEVQLAFLRAEYLFRRLLGSKLDKVFEVKVLDRRLWSEGCFDYLGERLVAAKNAVNLVRIISKNCFDYSRRLFFNFIGMACLLHSLRLLRPCLGSDVELA